MPLPENSVNVPDITPVRSPVLRFKQNTGTSVQAALRTVVGEVYTIPAEATIWLKATEFVTLPTYYFDVQCTLPDDPTTGIVTVTLTAEQLPTNGIWVGEFRVLDGAGNKIERFPAWVEVTGTLDAQQNNRPLSVAEIRLAVRDRRADQAGCPRSLCRRQLPSGQLRVDG